MIINFTKRFEPLHILKTSIIIVDGCTYAEMKHKKKIQLPDGTYLIQIKILPHFYSNTIMVNECDNEKTIFIESGLNRNIYLKIFSVIWACLVFVKFTTKWEFLNIPIIILSFLLLGSLLYFTKNVQNAIKITIQ